MLIRLIGYARNTREQAQGLQGRVLGDGEGMLFIYNPPIRTSFWNLGVPIPLDLVFFDKRDRVSGTATMAAWSRESVMSPGKISFALEVPAGTVARARILVGQKAKMFTSNAMEIGS